MRIHFSNRIEQLYDFFKKELYLNNPHPFAKRYVVVPSPAVKNWLTLRLADDPDFQLAMGFQVGFLDQTLNEFVANSHPQPSRLATSFSLELLLDERWRQGLLGQDLAGYLGDYNNRRGQRRLVQLADALSLLFQQYGVYGEKMVASWEEDPKQHWQAELWHELFSGDWSYPAAAYREQPRIPEVPTSIHLFSMSYLPQIHHRFLETLGQQIPVAYYILSPCQAFWSDLLTDREAGRLEAYWRKRGVMDTEQQALEEYLSDRNPLLANYGRLGRSLAKVLEESPSDVIACYGYSAAVEVGYGDHLVDEYITTPASSLSLLAAIQADVGLMRNPDEQLGLTFAEGDDSIVVHEAPTLIREVEVVRDMILQRVAKNGVAAHEVLVMAPDITTYAPLIESVFGREECPLDYQLLDVGKNLCSREVRLLLQLLNVPMGRWDVLSIIALIEGGVGFAPDEIDRVVNWLRQAEVRWGYDSSDRERLLVRDHGECSLSEPHNRGTWSDAMGRLVKGMVLERQHELDDTLEVIATAEGDLLGKCICFIRELREDLLPLMQGKKLVSEWVDLLEAIAAKYITSSDDAKNYLRESFDEMRNASSRIRQHRVPFESVKARLQAALERKESGYRENHLSAVRFCSMLPMRAIPARMIILMGMDEQSFPKRERPSNLNLMKEYRDLCDEMPSQVDFDRFLFLEAILSCRESLAMTYVSVSPTDGKKQPPSTVVSELLHYIEKAFNHTIVVQEHPSFAFHHSLFQEKSSFRSYSQRDFRFASLYYNPKKEVALTEKQLITSREEDSFIDLNYFLRCLKNPLIGYLRNGLKLNLRKDKGLIEEEESFEMNPLERYVVTKIGLKYSSEQLFDLIREQELLPQGLFGKVAWRRLYLEVEQIQQSKKSFGVDNDSFFEIRFSEEVDKPTYEKGEWIVPPLPLGSGRFVTGTLSECTESGIWIHDQCNEKGMNKGVGRYLLFREAINTFSLPMNADALFGKSAERKATPASQSMKAAVSLFDSAQKTPCHLCVDWIDPIINGDAAKLEKAIEDSKQRSHDVYTQWYLQNRQMPSPQTIIEEWNANAIEIYGDFYTQWLEKEVACDAHL